MISTRQPSHIRNKPRQPAASIKSADIIIGSTRIVVSLKPAAAGISPKTGAPANAGVLKRRPRVLYGGNMKMKAGVSCDLHRRRVAMLVVTAAGEMARGVRA